MGKNFHHEGEAPRCPPPTQWGRIFLIVAHPDDEALAIGGHLGTLHPRIAHLTDGALAGSRGQLHLQNRRRRELDRVLALSGIPSRHRIWCGMPDQQSASFLAELRSKLLAAFIHFAADCILTHPFEGGHPDHDTASLLASMIADDSGGAPIYEFTSYHNACPSEAVAQWKTGDFLQSQENAITVALTPRQQSMKRKLLSVYRSQKEVIDLFPKTFERFRRAPKYDYLTPPHSGTLLYEGFGWSTFAAWRQTVEGSLQAQA